MAFKIYTKTGDKGQTALFGGKRVSKSHIRVDAYGTVDELNSFVGFLRDQVHDAATQDMLIQIQHRLFTVGAHLASDPDKSLPTPDLKPEDILLLETAMDEMDRGLPELKNFILPGGSNAVSAAHLCRTVCRRAERVVIALSESGDTVDASVVMYLNRLSDYFFMLSRWLGFTAGAVEIKWNAREKT